MDAILEMCRVADEVRTFPLIDMANVPSPHVEHVRRELVARGYIVSIRSVPYCFQVGGDQMMVVTRKP